MQVANICEMSGLSRSILLLALVGLFIVNGVVLADLALLCVKIVLRRCWGAQSHEVGLDASSDIMRIDHLRQSAGLAQFTASVEFRSVASAIDLDTC